jgi:hypothetical protein
MLSKQPTGLLELDRRRFLCDDTQGAAQLVVTDLANSKITVTASLLLSILRVGQECVFITE